MNFTSPRFGPIEVDDDQILQLQGGLAGFPACERFIVMDHDRETPLKWLQCTDRPEIAFLIVEPEQFLPSFTLDIPEPALELLGWSGSACDISANDIAVFVILNAGTDSLTANLRAPIVTHIPRRRAVQLILDDPDIPIRHPVRPGPRLSSAASEASQGAPAPPGRP